MAKLRVRIQFISELDLEYEADMAILPGVDGQIGVMAGHINLLAPLKAGVVRIKNNDKETAVEIQKGFLVVDKEGVRVLS